MRQIVNNSNYSESVAIVPPIKGDRNAAAGSAKSWIVPNNELWKLNFVQAILTSSAVVGTRQLAVQVKDAAGNAVLDLVAGVTQAASLTQRYGFFQGVPRETALVAGSLQASLPEDLYLPPGYTLRVYDSAAVDAAGDTLTVSIQAMKFNV